MSEYRILRLQRGESCVYKTQKNFFGLFWYNPLNIDAYTTGFFDTKDEAKDAIKAIKSKTISSVVYED